MNTTRIRMGSVFWGAFFIAVALCAMFGQFENLERSKTIAPITLVIVGFVVVMTGVRRALSRNDS